MLVIGRGELVFGSRVLPGVVSVAVDRTASEEIVSFGDRGPHVAFADVPRVRVAIKVVRELSASEFDSVKPGEEGLLRVEVSPGRTENGRVSIEASAVAVRVTHAVEAKGATQTLVFVAIGVDGGAGEPVSVSGAEGA